MAKRGLLRACLFLAGSWAGAAAAMAAGGVQESGVPVRVSAGSSVKSIEVYLDVEGNSAREEQVAEEPDSLLTIGRVRETMVDPDSGKVEKRKALIDQPVLFYLYSPTSKVEAFEINIQSARTSEGFLSEGTTPAAFAVEALELRSVGEVRGRSLKKFEGVALKVGEANRFPLDVEIASGKTLGVKVWVAEPGTDELAVGVKASNKGKYPARVIRRGGEGEEPGQGLYNPDVVFSYKGAPPAGKLVAGNPLERVAEQINNYLRGQAKAGQTGEIAVPLRIRVQTSEGVPAGEEEPEK
ncbi:MAG: hypothetical protein HY816_08470 [Candidatus Wallbacteria bacterium]|nr:hypothetical protein [Candidatus Wallbacteria bacterium]